MGLVVAHFLEEEGLDMTRSAPPEFRNGPLAEMGQPANVYVVESEVRECSVELSDGGAGRARSPE